MEVIEKMSNHKKVLFGVLVFQALIIIAIAFCLSFIPRFHIKDFKSEIEVNVNAPFNYESSNVCYGIVFNCKNVEVTTSGDVNTSKLGTYEIEYKFSYNNKDMLKKQKIKVVDKLAPIITILDQELFYCPNKKAYKYNIKAIDNYDGDITSSIKTEVLDDTIVFSVKDKQGNTTKITKPAKVKDIEPPVITLNGDQVMYLALNHEFIDPLYQAIDYCDGDLTSNVEVTGVVDNTKIGENIINYKVTDLSSNETTITRTVWVYSNNNYNAPDGKSIYLTFDDGPGGSTNRLLDILAKYNVKATFFVTDQGLTKAHDDCIIRAYEEGHTIGLHTATHNYGYIYSSVDNYFEDLYAIQDKVYNLTGYKSTIIRFPGGSSNTVSRSYDNGTKIMSQLTQAVEARGFRYFDWNVGSRDSENADTPSLVSASVIDSLGSGSTYIVLQHDIKSFSVDAVESIIQYGLSHGYTFRPITMETPNMHHNVNN